MSNSPVQALLAHAYKPDPRAYRTAAGPLGLAPEQVMLVAADFLDLVRRLDA